MHPTPATPVTEISRYTDPSSLSPGTLLETDDLAVLLRTSPVTLKNWRRDGIGPRWVEAGKQRLYRASDLVAWLDEMYPT